MLDTVECSRRVDALHRLATKLKTQFPPPMPGELVWRHFPVSAGNAETLPRLLLAHGGSGSWTHWFRNLPYLSQRYRVTTIDLPGLGDSSSLPKGYSATDAVDAIWAGLPEAMGGEAFHLCAFSWGCAVTSQVSARCPEQLKSIMLVGPASLGNIERRGGMKPLIKRTPEMTQEEVFATNRENLARLMFYDREQIDDLAVYLQTENTNRARFNSPQFVKTSLTLDGVGSHRVPLHVLYGEQDAPGLPNIFDKQALFRAVRPDLAFTVVPECGHWLQYERPDRFHELIDAWIAANESA